MDRLFENHRQERIVKILKMIKEGKVVNRKTVGDLRKYIYRVNGHFWVDRIRITTSN